MNYFIAFPFTALINEKTMVIDDKVKNFLTGIREFLLEKGHNVFLAHYRENWGQDIMTAYECTSDDFKEMVNTDLVIAFPGDNPSGGVQVEMGWASALKKKIILFLNEKTTYTPLLHGLPTITETEIFFYKDFLTEEFQKYLFSILNENAMGDENVYTVKQVTKKV